MWLSQQAPCVGNTMQSGILSCRLCSHHIFTPRLRKAHVSSLQQRCRSPHAVSGLLGLLMDSRRQTRKQHMSNFRRAAHASLEENPASTSKDSTREGVEDTRIKRTLADLDALLGIEDEGSSKKVDESKEKKMADEKDDSFPAVSISQEVLESVAKAEAQRLSLDESFAKKLTSQMNNILETAAKQSSSDNVQEEKLGPEFTKLVEIMRGASEVDKEDVKKLKAEALGPNTFWVTNIQPVPLVSDLMVNSGWLIQGNLRADRSAVYEIIRSASERMFGKKYEVFMLEDPEAEDEDPRGGPRIAFQIVMANSLKPEPIGIGQSVLTVLLLLATISTALQLGLISSLTQYPPELAAYLFGTDVSETFDPQTIDFTGLLLGALPVFGAILGVQGIHEIGHAVVAFSKQVQLAPPILLPNAQLGTFGAVTNFRSIPNSKKDLFDIAIAGPGTAMLASMAIFLLGLWLSNGSPKEELLVVPSQLFQGSFLLGGLAKLGLGEAASKATGVSVHPALIIGWCGLITNSLNCLPVGSLDGGRMIQAAFGNRVLGVTSFLTYVGLVLGFIGSSLALPFCIFIVCFQRDPQKLIKDSVTDAGEPRQSIAAILVGLAVLILLPLGPEIIDSNILSGGLFL